MKGLMYFLVLIILVASGCGDKKEHFVSVKLIESYSFAELAAALDSANKVLAVREGVIPYSDSANPDFETYEKNNPIYALLRPNIHLQDNGLYVAGETSDFGYIDDIDTTRLLEYFRDSVVAAILPQDMRIIFSRNITGNLSAYAIHKDATVQKLDPAQVKHFEFQKTGISGVLGLNISNEESLFFIHFSEEITDKLSDLKPYTLLMTIDTTEYTGTYNKSNPPSAANMNYISRQDKEALEEMFEGKIIRN